METSNAISSHISYLSYITHVCPPRYIKRPRSAPAALEKWENNDFAWSDTASYNYTTSSDTDAEDDQPDVQRTQHNEKDDHGSFSHSQLANYARSIQDFIKDAMDRLSINNPELEPFPAYNDDGFIEENGTSDAGEGSSHASSPQPRTPGDYQVPSLEIKPSLGDRNNSTTIGSGLLEQHRAASPEAFVTESRRLYRKKGCYFHASKDRTDINRDASRIRRSKDDHQPNDV